jgi:hypothetical protein
MDDPFTSISHLLTEVILPNLRAVQASQADHIASNDRIEQSIEELQMHLRSQFALLNAQLTACRAEVAALQAALEEAKSRKDLAGNNRASLVH